MMASSTSQIRVGYVPEHFSTPLHFAQKYFSLSVELIAFPSGTGHMITALRANEIDVGIGLTEGWVAGLGKGDIEGDGGYRIVGTYVKTPLCWAISTGTQRNINSISDLHNSKIGVSRIGSGSYVMGFVLADQQGWLSPSSSSTDKKDPFQVVPLQTFEKLREGVNDGTADFFMWEHFTSKRYFDNDEIRRIGEIYTPWSSWKIVAATKLISPSPVNKESGRATLDVRLEDLFEKLNLGVQYFLGQQEEAVGYISTELDYSEADAREWLKTVEFVRDVRVVDTEVIQKTIDVLKKAGVIGDGGLEATAMIVKCSVAQVPS